jgi:hypothetical protein
MNYNNKFQDCEKVLLREQNEIVTVSRWSYIPKKRVYSYTIIENPATFYFEHELDFARSAIKATEIAQAEE